MKKKKGQVFKASDSIPSRLNSDSIRALKTNRVTEMVYTAWMGGGREGEGGRARGANRKSDGDNGGRLRVGGEGEKTRWKYSI